MIASGQAARCPLCRSERPAPRETLEAASVDRDWREKYGIAVQQYFAGGNTRRYECDECKLEFFAPPCPGDGEMYGKLQEFDWYYEDAKWEFRTARSFLERSASILEIGCGAGKFLGQLLDEGYTDVSGLDSNLKALAMAKARGITTYASREEVGGRKFDMILAFQILEHIPDTRSFLEDVVNLLSERGRLLIAVPNQGSFIGDGVGDILNQPPHHCARFRTTTLENVGRYVPLRLQTIEFEPLSKNHVGWFVSTKLGKLERVPPLYRAAWKVLGHASQTALQNERLRRHFWGHSMLAVYQRSTAGAAAAGPSAA